MMSLPDMLTLRTRIDDYSFQVSAVEDERFWFRLERHEGRDVITDFFLGALPEHDAGRLLADCYRALGMTPKPVVVFGDILPSRGPIRIDEALTAARDFYSASGKALLTGLGAGKVVGRLVQERGKFHLVMKVIRDASATPEEGGRE